MVFLKDLKRLDGNLLCGTIQSELVTLIVTVFLNDLKNWVEIGTAGVVFEELGGHL